MKKHLLFLLYFITSLSCYGYDFKVDGVFYNILSHEDKTCEVTYGDSVLSEYGGIASFYEGDIVIPEMVLVDGEIYKVIKIGDCAFYCCNNVTNIEIPSTILQVGNASFVCCTGLKSFSFSEGVQYVGYGAFDGCSSLESVHFSSSIYRINTDALFCYCTSLRSITVSDKNERFKSVNNCLLSKDGKILYRGCRTSIIPDGVKVIDEDAFDGCQTLETINIPSSVEAIGSYAFWRCTGLKGDFVIPDGVRRIERGAFCGCSSITSVVISASVTNIGNMAFYGCSSLTSVYVNWNTPLLVELDLFSGIDKTICTLYVPQGISDDYRLSRWGEEFDNIVEYNATGINQEANGSEAKEISRYSADGKWLYAPTKGVNIVRYSNGNVKKVFVK